MDLFTRERRARGMGKEERMGELIKWAKDNCLGRPRADGCRQGPAGDITTGARLLGAAGERAVMAKQRQAETHKAKSGTANAAGERTAAGTTAH